jgi:hypothetical protein
MPNDKDCHCGSGDHPRKCDKHPWGFSMHVLIMNYDNLRDYYDELEERILALETSLKTIEDKK